MHGSTQCIGHGTLDRLHWGNWSLFRRSTVSNKKQPHAGPKDRLIQHNSMPMIGRFGVRIMVFLIEMQVQSRALLEQVRNGLI
jgi:hypothetical protein